MVTQDDLPSYGATATLLEAMSNCSPPPLRRVDRKRLDYFRKVATKHGGEFLNRGKAAAVCQLGTIHSVKGLEADHVILCSGMPPRTVEMLDEEAERRVFYVGMTRARERLTLARSTEVKKHWDDVL